MSAASATVNGQRAVSVVLTTLWRGAWWAEVDLDPDDAQSPPTGSVGLAMLGGTLRGTVDPRFSGRMLASNRLRVVGGAGGWDKPVSRQDYHNDAGVTSTQVYQAAGLAVGETIADPSPITFGADFEQLAGAASACFQDRNWYVDGAGVTQVSDWPAVAPDASLQILDYNPERQEILISSDALVLPGTTFTDGRFDGTLTARDVEQAVSTGGGSRARVWCSATPGTRTMNAFTNLVRRLSGFQENRSYRYRVVTQGGDGRLDLQAVDAALGMPDLKLKPMWPGMPGESATVQLGATCDVRFQEGTSPIVSNWAPGAKALTRTIDATTSVAIGPNALHVDLAGGFYTLARGDILSGLLTVLDTFATSCTAGPTALAAAASQLSTDVATLLTAAPITKTKAT